MIFELWNKLQQRIGIQESPEIQKQRQFLKDTKDLWGRIQYHQSVLNDREKMRDKAVSDVHKLYAQEMAVNLEREDRIRDEHWIEQAIIDWKKARLELTVKRRELEKAWILRDAEYQLQFYKVKAMREHYEKMRLDNE